MFTGIVTDMGEVLALEQQGDLRARIGTAYDIGRHRHRRVDRLRRGLPDGGGPGQSAQLVRRADLGRDRQQDQHRANGWRVGQRLNLERALKVGDELGGHIVSGHVDGVAEVVAMRAEGDSLRVTFRAPEALARFIAPKGVGRAERHLADGERGGGLRFRRQLHPAHAGGHDLGRRGGGRCGEPRDRHAWPAMWRGCGNGGNDRAQRRARSMAAGASLAPALLDGGARRAAADTCRSRWCACG